MTAEERAVGYFNEGYNCAQSSAAAFAEEAGLDPRTVLRVMAGFGGGVGGSREMCGAVSGMVFVLGLFCGGYGPHDDEAKTQFYQEVRGALAEFREKFGTTCCKELLLKAGCLPKPDPAVRNAEYYAMRPCACFVAEAARIAESRRRSDEPRD